MLCVVIVRHVLHVCGNCSIQFLFVLHPTDMGWTYIVDASVNTKRKKEKTAINYLIIVDPVELTMACFTAQSRLCTTLWW